MYVCMYEAPITETAQATLLKFYRRAYLKSLHIRAIRLTIIILNYDFRPFLPRMFGILLLPNDRL